MLGRGGFACVYRARSLKTGQEVAIKMVSLDMICTSRNAWVTKPNLCQNVSLSKLRLSRAGCCIDSHSIVPSEENIICEDFRNLFSSLGCRGGYDLLSVAVSDSQTIYLLIHEYHVEPICQSSYLMKTAEIDPIPSGFVPKVVMVIYWSVEVAFFSCVYLCLFAFLNEVSCICDFLFVFF